MAMKFMLDSFFKGIKNALHEKRVFWSSPYKIEVMITSLIVSKNSKKVKIIRNYVLKCNLYLYFFIKQNLQISGEKMLMSAKLLGCVT